MTKKCFACGQTYKTKHPSYEEAMATNDRESREQWISGCCGDGCWDNIFKAETERFDEAGADE